MKYSRVLSIVVCTFRREHFLQQCLKSLINQNTDNRNFEIVVVNNFPADQLEFSQEMFKDIRNIRFISEKNTGLSYARNTGWNEASGKYIAYIDDDALAEKNWISEILNFIRKYPDVEAFGGSYYSFSDKSIPYWYPKEILNYELGTEVRKLNIGQEWLTGTNMIFSRSLLKKVGGFKTNLGMKGPKLGYGEEVEFQHQIEVLKIPIYYSPKLKVKHYLSPNKISLRWLIRNCYIVGGDSLIFNRNNKSLFTEIISLIKSVIYGCWLFISKYRYPLKTRLYYAINEPATRIGRLFTIMN